ncbi:MAG: coenzyme F430 synthase [Methanobacterium sp.]|jgi:UDP-N-acetylmuramyl pentapeptide synthase|nr:coenzyme F430 synthase [Methanobacterium sp.]
MKVLVVDMTHGGFVLASEFSKRNDCDVFAWDIYHTLNHEQIKTLKFMGIKLVEGSFYEKYYQETYTTEENEKINVVAPVHCNLPYPADMTHHEAVGFLLKDRINVPIIEITGVKGKTSTLAMLKEIYRDQNLLILSSLGVEIVDNGQDTILQKDISITPASIITAWDLAEDFYKAKKPSKPDVNTNIDICLFESSLGGTGLADVGVITNIAEDYPISQGSSSASKAKSQMFRSKIIVCDHESYHGIYSENNNYYQFLTDKKINTYSVDGKSNVQAFDIDYGLYETTFQVKVTGLQTVENKYVNNFFQVKTFAPAQHHLENTLSAITASLSLGTIPNSIIKGVKNFRGLPGRTSFRNISSVETSLNPSMQNKSSFVKKNYQTNHQIINLIEEINPGINVTAIKKSVAMIKDYENPALVLGGNYGVTCEEIDEESLLEYLSQIGNDLYIILTGELGKSLWDKTSEKSIYRSQIDQAINQAINEGFNNILIVYRSNFSDLSKR